MNKLIIVVGLIMITSACNRNKLGHDASGTFEATEVMVSAESLGKIMTFDLREGQALQANQQIGSIDSIQLYLKKMQLIANQKAVKSRYVDISKQIAATQEQIVTQEHERQRFENLVKSNAANQKQLDDINAGIIVLQKQLAAQRSTLENNNMGISEESSALEIQVAQLEDQLHKCRIASPIAGIVLAKYAEKGELATQGRALFKIADINDMFLRAYISSDQLSKVTVGQQVKVFADFGDNSKEYSGTITWISDKSEFTPKTIQTKDERANLVYAVKIAVKNDGYLKIGMYGEVDL